MDIGTSAEREKFLYIFGTPYKSFLNCLSLRSAVLLLVTMDLILGAFNSLIGLGLFAGLIFSSIPLTALSLLALLSTIINVIGIPFAVIGLSGITNLSVKHLQYYYQFEMFEMFFEGFLNLIEATLFSVDYYGGYAHFHPDSHLLNITGAIVSIVLSGFAIKVVWSALIRLKYREYILVTHGEKAYIELKNSAGSLVEPKVISPGIPIYFSENI